MKTHKFWGVPILLICCFFSHFAANSQSFTQSQLDFNGNGSVSNGVTSLMYGPDGRLYVAEYPGLIKILTIVRNNATSYQVTDVEILDGIQTMADHNDDGSSYSSTERETTGLTVTGTTTNPVIYVASSDFRIGAGSGGGNGDVDLDTNSGVITRFTWNGSSWDVVDIVRGLPRSEENHATNGLEFTTINGVDYLIVASGGHTNAGAPSTNFVYTCEYALSAAILSVNLDMIESLPILNDNGRSYIYDLPTLDDPTRNNVNGITDPDDPGYDGIDVNDPWGGNDGLNQAIVDPSGPVQIYSPGYRNSYDIVLTTSGALYATDNGANGGWGGFPVNEGGGSATNAYDPSEPGSQSPSGSEQIDNVDHLQLITTDVQTYVPGSLYGGHPNPTRANPTGAGLYTDNGTSQVFRTLIYDPDGSTPGSTTDPNIGLPANWPPVQVANPVEGDWRGPTVTNPDGPEDSPVATWGTNTNGIDEYTASNFGGAMQGDLLAGHSAGLVRRVQLQADGTLQTLTTNFLSGIGGDALGITCNGDAEIYPGTVWAGTLGGLIVVFEPQDFINCSEPGDASYDPTADGDLDGYLNQDEVDNDTQVCNGGSQPDDFDKAAGGSPLVSNLNDSDDDADGVSDALDPFQLGNPIDSGSDAFTLPILNDLFNSQQGLGGIFGLGMTGLMNNGDTGPNWIDWIDKKGQGPNPDDVLGGAPGIMTSHMTAGTALGNSNNQDKGYQYGVQVDNSTGNFTVIGGMNGFTGPLRLYENTDGVTNGELGFFIGDGTQSNYIKFVATTDGFTALQEIDDVPGTPVQISLPVGSRPTDGIRFYFLVDPVAGTVDLEYQIDDNARVLLGSINALGNVLQAIQSTATDLAVGFIGSSNTAGKELEGSWDFLNVLAEEPILIQKFPDIVRTVNTGNEVIDLQDYFNDNDLGGLVYTVQNNTNPAIGANISNNLLTISYPSTIESTTLTIRATDSEDFFVEDTFDINVIEAFDVLFRVNAGGPEITAIDGGLNWEEDSAANGSQYLIDDGTNETYSGTVTSVDSSVNSSTTPFTLFDTERSDLSSGTPNLSYSFPVPQSGNYEVRLYMANSFPGTSEANERIFDVLLEGDNFPLLDDIDLSGTYGHATGTMISHVVSVNDGFLNIEFVHGSIENPLINAIEILQAQASATPIYLYALNDQANNEGEQLDGSLGVQAIGGDGNLQYSAVGLPPGITIEPTNGQIGGTVAADAATGSPYNVTINVDDSDSDSNDIETIAFEWVIFPTDLFELRLNAGGPALTSGGLDFSADSDFTGGKTFSNTAATVPALYQTERSASPPEEFSYDFTVPNGEYQVILHFAEIYFGADGGGTGGVGDRVFDVSAEGVTILDDYDIYADVGPQTEVAKSFLVTVSDGELNLYFDALGSDGVDQPKVSAIEVLGTSGSQFPSISVDAIADQTSDTGTDIFGPTVSATGGDPAADFVYGISGQPAGVVIDTETGFIFGTVSQEAATGGPNGDGIYNVTVSVSKTGSITANVNFDWTVIETECVWNNLSDANYSRFLTRNELVGDKIYVMGGWLPGINASTDLEIYDITNDTWTVGADLLLPLTHMGSVAYGNQIWLIGGFVGNLGNPSELTEKVQVYDIATDTWSYGPDLPKAVGSGAATLNGDKIHFFGGLEPDISTDIPDHYVLDLTNIAAGWTTAAPMLVARNHLGAETVNGIVYAIGGQVGHDGPHSDVDILEAYDPSTDSWTTRTSLPKARSHFESGTTVNNGKLIIVGGQEETDFYSDDITQYDPQTDQWAELCKLPNNRLSPMAKVYGDRLIVSGGGIDGFSNLIPTTQWIQLDNLTAPLTITPLADRTDSVGDLISFSASADGGDTSQPIVYGITGAPSGMSINASTGEVSGTLDVAALTGGTNGDGIHSVTVTANRLGSSEVQTSFTWTVNEYTGWFVKNENQNYTGRHECGFVQAGDKFYLMGGRESSKTEVYNYGTDSWTDLGSSPVNLNHFQAVVYEGLIWVIGSLKNDSFPNDTPADYIWIFDPISETWIQGPEIPQARKRGAAGMVLYNDVFYIVGGNTNGHAGGYVPWFDSYNPATGEWTSLTDAPHARDHFYAAVIDDKLYALSGRQSGGPGGVFAPTVPEVDVFDFTNQQWSTLPANLNIPTPRSGPSVAVYNNKLMVIGGGVEEEIVYGTTVTDDVLTITEEFDPATQEWKRLADTNFKRRATQAIVSGNSIYVASGSPVPAGGIMKNMEYYGTDNPQGTPLTASDLIVPSTVYFASGNTQNIPLEAANGNSGMIIQSVEITGPNAGDFSVDTSLLNQVLLSANSTIDLPVELIGTGTDLTATLTINYGIDSSVNVALTNSDPAVLVIDSIDNRTDWIGSQITLNAVAYGGDTSQPISYSIVGQPEGLDIDTSTGEISGTISSNALTGGTNNDGVHDVTVTASRQGSSDVDSQFTWAIVEQPTVFFRFNAGGPALTSGGLDFSADSDFTGGKTFSNTAATVPALYQTERSASPPEEFSYDFTVPNGEYQVILHFAEIYFGADGGGTGGVGDRVFDVSAEGVTILDDYDIYADVGPQTEVAKSFLVTVSDGELNLYFDALGSDGVDQPKVSAIEVLGTSGSQFPSISVDAIADQTSDTGTDIFGPTVSATGGDPAADFVYGISGQPAGVVIDTETGFIFGTVSQEAATGGPNGDGIYNVTVSVSKTGSATANVNFDWTVIETECVWNNLSDANYSRFLTRNELVGDKIYVMGGWLPGINASTDLEIYDITNDTWTVGADLLLPLTHMGSVAYGNQIWLIGGFVGNLGNPSELTEKVQVYDIATDTWSYGPDLPKAVGSGAATLNGDKIHFFGGLEPDISTDIPDHYVLDLTNIAAGWTTAAPMLVARNHLGAETVNGIVYAIGGQVGHDGPHSDVDILEAYDPSTDSWTTRTSLPKARSHFESGTTVNNGKLIIVGGQEETDFYSDDITQYDPQTDQWAELCKLPNNRLSPMAKVYGDRLIVSGGGIDGFSNLIPTTQWIQLDNLTAPLTITPLADRTDSVGDLISFSASADGGDTSQPIVYGMTGAPSGMDIDTSTGEISGTLDPSALTGGTNGDGVHNVTVTASRLGAADVQTNFTWIVNSTIVSDLPWSEDFAGLLDGSTSDVGGTAWSSVVSGGSFEVEGGTMVLRGVNGGNTGTWTSQTIVIAGHSDVSVSVEVDDLDENKEPADYVTAYYSLDGGPLVAFGTVTDDIASPVTLSATGLSGTDLQIVIEVQVSYGGETYVLDNINVGGIPVIPTPVTGVSVAPLDLTLDLDASPMGLTATVAPSNASNTAVIWSSSDETVATVDSFGTVTPVGLGNAQITVTTVDGGYQAQSSITVQEPVPVAVTGVLVSPSTVSMTVGGATTTLQADVTPVDADDPSVTWGSSDDAIATVDTNGTVTAVSEGVATITATTVDGGFTSSSEITVSAAPLSDLPWSEDFAGLLDGSTSDVGDTAWSSVVSGGSFEVEGGTMVLRGVNGGNTGTWTSQTIVIAGHSDVSVSVEVDDLDENKEPADYVTAYYSLDGGPLVAFGTVTDDIASPVTLSATGLSGTDLQIVIEVQVSYGGETYVLDNINVGGIPVIPTPVTGVSVAPLDLTLDLDASPVGLTATVAPSNASNTAVIWSSSDETVATVDSFGTVTPVGLGNAQITVTTVDGGYQAQSSITVQEPVPVAVTGVLVSPSTVSMTVGGATTTLQADVTPVDADDPSVTWGSSDDAIATVDTNGTVTAVSEGVATITATTVDGGFTSSSEITVSAAPLSDLPWSEDFAGLLDGSTSDVGDTAWSSVVSGGSFEVEGGTMVLRGVNGGNTGTWTSQTIVIAGHSDVSVSVEVDDLDENKEPADYVTAYYSLDGGPLVAFGTVTDDIASPVTLSATGLSGTDLQIVIEVQVSYGTETYVIDNISVDEIPAAISLKASIPQLELEVSEVLFHYPNPTADIVNLWFDSENKKIKKVDVYDASGRKVQSFDKTSENQSSARIDLSGLQPGVYNLMVLDDTLNVYVKRVVLE